MDLLRKHGIRIPELPQPPARLSGQSKLKKWSCLSTNVGRPQSARERGKSGPQPLRELIAIVLARLGVGVIPSNPSGEEDLT
jgi:hypothetical protein